MFIAAIGPSKLGYAQIAKSNYVSAPQNNISFTSNSASQSNWLELTNELGIDSSVAKKTFQDIQAAYAPNQGRFYHTLDHVSHMLDELEGFCASNPGKITRTQKAMLKLAVWFHDFRDERLNPTAVDESAKIAADFLANSSTHKDQIPLVKDLIMVTKYFANPKLNDEFKFLTGLMQDLDLSALGISWDKFYTNNINLRKEAYAVGKTEEQALAGQKWFLGKLCDQESIFQTDWFKGRYERTSRENIARLLKLIK